jgi:EAL domain-containing protein (putative c-di-GMP-specific phosphodiesterase class I)
MWNSLWLIFFPNSHALSTSLAERRRSFVQAMRRAFAMAAMSLLSKADAAMYEVKISGRNGYRHYIPGISTYSEERLGLESDLKLALSNEELFLCYQPQFSLSTGAVVGVEALIRWRHPQRGVLSPGSFIGIAEESGLIVPIGDWVLATACAQARAWREEGLPPLRMAVNISALQFRQVDFAQRVRRLLESGCLEPSLLEPELTESMVMSRAPQVRETLEELQSIGVQLSLDDFGTGFPSLGYLRRFPINRLKVDQSFVRGGPRHSRQCLHHPRHRRPCSKPLHRSGGRGRGKRGGTGGGAGVRL